MVEMLLERMADLENQIAEKKNRIRTMRHDSMTYKIEVKRIKSLEKMHGLNQFLYRQITHSETLH